MREERQSELVKDMISEAVLAGAYAVEIRRDPALARGFGKLLAKHSGRAANLANEICRAADGRLIATADLRVPNRAER